MPVPTIKDLFTPINSISTCLESKAAIISKNLVDINNSITGAATALGEKSKSIKDSIDDAKKDIIKSLKDLNNTNVGKTKQGTNLKNIEKLSKEFSSNLATGITSISTTFANSALHFLPVALVLFADAGMRIWTITLSSLAIAFLLVLFVTISEIDE